MRLFRVSPVHFPVLSSQVFLFIFGCVTPNLSLTARVSLLAYVRSRVPFAPSNEDPAIGTLVAELVLNASDYEMIMVNLTPLPQPYPMSWYALRIQSRLSGLASVTLRGKGYEEFLPLYRARRRWSDRVKQVELPLFPGYLFCQFDVNDKIG